MKYRLFFSALFFFVTASSLAAIVYDSGYGVYYSQPSSYVAGYNPYSGNVYFSTGTPYVTRYTQQYYYPSQQYYGYQYYPNYQGYYDAYGNYYTTSYRAAGTCYWNGFTTVCY